MSPKYETYIGFLPVDVSKDTALVSIGKGKNPTTALICYTYPNSDILARTAIGFFYIPNGAYTILSTIKGVKS